MSTVSQRSFPEVVRAWVYHNSVSVCTLVWLAGVLAVAGAVSACGCVLALCLTGFVQIAVVLGFYSVLRVELPNDRVEVPVSVEAIVADMLEVGDCTWVGKQCTEDVLEAKDRVLSRGARDWVVRAKLHFGEVKDTPADQLCVKRWLAEQMKAADVRNVDAAGMIPVVAFMCTVPDSNDMLANFMRQSMVVKNARVLGGPPRVA